MDDFAAAEIHTGETTVFLRWGGAGRPLLLLHGFPETHLMWAGVAGLLADRHTVICPDLRGYGRSGCPASDAEHAAYSKRAMARDPVGAMERLGHSRFLVTGHDRGGRVAHRLALDHPDRGDRLAVLDTVPTEAAWARADGPPTHAHAICEEYRAAAAIDRAHARSDRDAGRRIQCPCWSSGARRERSLPGMPPRAGRSRSGGTGRRASKDTR